MPNKKAKDRKRKRAALNKKLKPKEQKDEQGNVIDIGNGKDRHTKN